MPNRWKCMALASLALLVTACSNPAPTATPQAATATPPPTATPVPTPTATTTPLPTPTPFISVPDQGASEGNLRVAVRAEPASLNLVQDRDPDAWPFLLPQLSWLVANEQGRRGPVSDLADRWGIGAGGLQYTFHLALGVTWHDGAPLTADDAVFSINRAREAVGAPYGQTLSAVQSVQAMDSATVRITLRRPDPAFIAGLGVPGNVVLARHAAPESLVDFRAMGTGPFRFVRRLEGIKTVLQRNPAYFKKDAGGQALPYLSGIELILVPDTNTEWALMRLGQLELSSPARPREWGKSREDVEQRLATFVVDPFAPLEYDLTFPNRGYWTNVKLRQAVRDIVGRRVFHTAMNFDYGTLLGFLMPSAGRWALPPPELVVLPGYVDPPMQPEAQRRSLEAAGIPVPPRALLRTLEGHEAAAGIALAQVQTLFSQGAALVVDDPGAFLASEVALQFDLLVEPVAFRLDDPAFILDRRFRTFGPDNAGRWSDPEIDALLNRIASQMDPSIRHAHTLALERRLLELSWSVPLGTDVMLRAYSRKVWGMWTPLNLDDGPAYRMEQVWLRG